MGTLQRIDSTNDLYDIRKMKVMYEIGYADSIAYMRNIDTYEVRVKKIE